MSELRRNHCPVSGTISEATRALRYRAASDRAGGWKRCAPGSGSRSGVHNMLPDWPRGRSKVSYKVERQPGCRRAAGGLSADCRRAAGELPASCRRAAGELPAGCRSTPLRRSGDSRAGSSSCRVPLFICGSTLGTLVPILKLSKVPAAPAVGELSVGLSVSCRRAAGGLPVSCRRAVARQSGRQLELPCSTIYWRVHVRHIGS